MHTSCEKASLEVCRQAAEYLKKGEIAAIPTETVYGLAADATNGQAVKKIFEAKGRPQDNPLISHISSMEMLPMVWRKVTPQAKALAEAFWPGPLTIILPRSELLADEVCAGLPTAAVRWPSHPVAQQVITLAGVPLAAPSANTSGSPSPTTAESVMQDMAGKIPMVVDGGTCEVGVESTVVSLAGQTPLLLRPGGVTKEELERVLGCEVKLSDAVLHQLQEGEKPASPGMKYRHYAPNARVLIVQGSSAQYCEYVKAHAEEGDCALCFEEDIKALSGIACIPYGKEGDGVSQAHGLFAALRALDEKHVKTAYARCPQQSGISLAVYNRLLRAAAFQVVQV